MNPFDFICAAVTFRINTEAGIIGKPDFEFKLRKKDAEIVSKALYGVNKRDPLKFSVKRLTLAAALSSSAVTGIIVSVPIISRMGTLLDIAVSEILMAAERFSGRGLIWPLFYTGVYFLVFNGVLTVLFNKIEKKLDYYKV